MGTAVGAGQCSSTWGPHARTHARTHRKNGKRTHLGVVVKSLVLLAV